MLIEQDHVVQWDEIDEAATRAKADAAAAALRNHEDPHPYRMRHVEVADVMVTRRGRMIALAYQPAEAAPVIGSSMNSYTPRGVPVASRFVALIITSDGRFVSKDPTTLRIFDAPVPMPKPAPTATPGPGVPRAG
jgi:malic enzyme